MTGGVSAMDRAAFLEHFGGVYEHSSWIAEQVFDTGLGPLTDTPSGLSAAMREVVDQAGREPQRVLLRAHPDLAGRLAVSGELTAASSAEQAGAGLDQCTPEEFSAFTELNTRYSEKFGFPFIVAVRGLDRAGILDRFRQRVEHDQDTEFNEALSQVHRIARLRIDDVFAQIRT